MVEKGDGEVGETSGVVCEGELDDGWEEEMPGIGRTFTCGDDCSEVFDERVGVVGGNLAGVSTGVVVSAKTTGIARAASV
jgi:hypothetical protein